MPPQRKIVQATPLKFNERFDLGTSEVQSKKEKGAAINLLSPESPVINVTRVHLNIY